MDRLAEKKNIGLNIMFLQSETWNLRFNLISFTSRVLFITMSPPLELTID